MTSNPIQNLSTKPITELFEEALRFHFDGELTQAKNLYQLILVKSPDNSDTLHLLGMLLSQEKNYEEAYPYLIKALELEPENANYHNSLGNLYKATRTFDKSQIHYEKSLELTPNNAETHNNIANLFYATKQFDKALSHYAKAVNLKPDYIDAHFNLGMLFLQQGNFEAGSKQFQNVITLAPHQNIARKLLADCYLQEDRLQDAMKQYQFILIDDPNNVAVLNNLGVTFLKLKQPENAIEQFSKVVLIEANHIEARNNLAATFLQEDRFDNAARHYQILLESIPDDINVHYNLAVALMAIGKLHEAIDHFQFVLSKVSNNIDSLNNLAAIYLKLNKITDAIALYQKTLQIDPQDKLAKYMLDALTQTNTPQSAPEIYIKNLFDNYAGYYNKHVNEVLQYQAPDLLYLSVKQHFPNLKNVSLLDLGCGTGLVGSRFKMISNKIIGVDISTKMLKIAELSKAYDQLYEDDITHYLKHDNNTYDMIIAADVFVYCGDLAEIFSQVATHLNPQGLFAFTIEAALDDESNSYVLRKTARFAHARNYIETLVNDNHFHVFEFSEITPRKQDNISVNGYLYLLQKMTV